MSDRSTFLAEFSAQLKEHLKSQTASLIGEIPFSVPGGNSSPQEEIKAALQNPKILEIIETLQRNLLLVEPCRRWLRTKVGELAGAQLQVLYSPQELEELRKQAEQSQS